MSYTLYLLGFVIAIGALAYGSVLLGVPRVWVIIGALALLGLAIASGAAKTPAKGPLT
jgi:hypothetical protein